MENNSETLFEIHKNSVEKIKVCKVLRNGKTYVDVRIWYIPNPAEPGCEIATKKGIQFHEDLLDEMTKALQTAQEMLRNGSASVRGEHPQEAQEA